MERDCFDWREKTVVVRSLISLGGIGFAIVDNGGKTVDTLLNERRKVELVVAVVGSRVRLRC